jgi:hypothetical protein
MQFGTNQPIRGNDTEKEEEVMESTRWTHGSPRRRSAWGFHVGVPLVITVALLTIGCQQAAAPESSAEELSTATAAPSVAETATEAATPSASPSASGDCLDAAVVAALDEVRTGNLDTDPTLDQIADALEALPLEGPAADVRDGYVIDLRKEPPDEDGLVMGLNRLRAEVALPEC